MNILKIINRKTNRIFSVFGTKENEDGIIFFLVYDFSVWEWLPAADFKPYN
jgi:hypothetical protein